MIFSLALANDINKKGHPWMSFLLFVSFRGFGNVNAEAGTVICGGVSTGNLGDVKANIAVLLIKGFVHNHTACAVASACQCVCNAQGLPTLKAVLVAGENINNGTDGQGILGKDLGCNEPGTVACVGNHV